MSLPPPQGYDKRRFQNCATEDFDCFICTEVAKKPKQCENCLKVFCQLCIDDWFKRSAQCPYRCDQQYRIGSFKNKDQEIVYYNLNLECYHCKSLHNIKHIDDHEMECILPKCQNYSNCKKKVQTGIQQNQYSKMQFCSPECQFFQNVLNHASNQNILYKEITKFMEKYYPNLDTANSSNSVQIIHKQQSFDQFAMGIKPSFNYPAINEQPFQQFGNLYGFNDNNNIRLSWDPSAVGLQTQIINESTIFLKEQSYIFRSAITKQCFNKGIHYWEITPSDKTENEMKIGVSTKQQFDYNTAFSDYPFGFAYYGLGQLRSGNNSKGNTYGQKFKQSGVLGVHLNMNTGQLSFALNGVSFGVAFTDSKLKQGPIYPAIAMLHCAGCTITYKTEIPSYFPK